MRRHKLLIVTLLTCWIAVVARADQYEHEWIENGFHILELREDGGDTPLFTILRIEYANVGAGQLKIYVPAEDREAIRAALAGVSFTAEIADSQGSTPVSLSFYQMCHCSGSTTAYGYIYTGQLCEDRCGDAGVEEEEYYFRIFVTLDPGTDLAIGLDPTQLWLIERQ